MKKLLLTALFVGTFFCASAQGNKNVEKGLFKINAFTPGVTYEVGIGKDMTINLDALLVLGGGSRGPKDFNIGLFPGFDAEFRYFNNFNRRLSKGKNIAGNSGNYWALNSGVLIGRPIIGTYNLVYDTSIHLGAAYGLQRTYKKGFYWNLSFGPGFFFTREEFRFPSSTINVDNTAFGISGVGKIGWVIGGRKK